MRLHPSARAPSAPSSSPQPSPTSKSFNPTLATSPHPSFQSPLGSPSPASYPARTIATPPRTPRAFDTPNHQPHRDTATWPTHPQAAPPIVVPSAHWTADVQTFTVRSEPSFTVYCTVVRPVPISCVSRLWNWLTGAGSQVHAPATEHCTNGDEDNALDADSVGIKVPDDNDRVDKATSPTSHTHSCQRPAGPRQRPQPASRRYSGWDGVFSLDNSSEDDCDAPMFAVDDTSGRLLVPNVDVGVEYLVREEHEDIVPLGTTAAIEELSTSVVWLGVDPEPELELDLDLDPETWWVIAE